MPTVDLNADLAEGCGADIPLIGRISSANIACAVHAGSIADMKTAVQAALRNGVRIGAHPGYPDRENFGRSDMRLSRDDLAACLNYQLGALDALCRAEGAVLSYVKPHGAMYNLAARDRDCRHGVPLQSRAQTDGAFRQPAASGRCRTRFGRNFRSVR